MARYSKFIVAVAGAITTGLQTYYATAHWEPIVTTAITAVLVYLVPNVPASGGVSNGTPQR